MTGHFDKAMQDIAVRSARNGGPGIADVLDALVALDKDSVQAHQETYSRFDRVEEAFRAHCSEGQERDRRITKLELLVTPLNKPRRDDDPAGENHRADRTLPTIATTEQTTRRVWVMWGVGLWLATVAGATLVDKLIQSIWN